MRLWRKRQGLGDDGPMPRFVPAEATVAERKRSTPDRLGARLGGMLEELGRDDERDQIIRGNY
jgi:hypothetical protein